MENTIDGLKQLVICLRNNSEELKIVQEKRHTLITPLHECIYGAFRYGSIDLDSIDVDFSGKHISFKIDNFEDCSDFYTFPIECFVSSQTLSDYHMEKIETAKKEEIRRAEEDDAKEEHELYMKLKEKFEGHSL